MIGVGHFKTTPQMRKNIKDVLDTGRLSYGKYTKLFEQSFATLHQRKYGIFSNSGTSALQIGLHALKIKHNYKDGDEVIVPALTFVATVNIVLQNNMKPVLVDVGEDYNIDVSKIEAAITPRTKVILPVHIAGKPADMREIHRIALHHKLQVIEDSCETMFVKSGNKMVGAWSDVSCFSTYVAHILTTGVGGFSLTSDPKLAKLMRSLCNHGRDGIYVSMDDNSKGNMVISKRFKFDHVGYSYRATELESAIGVAQLATAKRDIEKRNKNAQVLFDGLSKHPELKLPVVEKEHAFMFFPITVLGGKERRKSLLNYLESNGVETRYLLPLTNQPVYKNIFKQSDYPMAKRFNESSFYIACHPGLTKENLSHIIKTFDKFYGR